MKKNLLFSFITLISFMFLMTSSVEAKRFGGGFSFGGKKSYSSPYKQKAAPQKSFSQQKASAANQQRKQQLSSRGGLMGMLGGLALGGMLGALFFGGAFENFNFFDFLIIGGLIWAVIWFLRRKAPSPQVQSSAGAYDFNVATETPEQNKKDITENQFKLNADKEDAEFATGSSNSATKQGNKEASFAESFGMNSGTTANSTETEQNPQPDSVILPDWFDQNEFLDGARSAYTMLQQAWDEGDLDSIKTLATESVYSEIAQQFADQSSRGTTRIIQLNAELIDFNELDEHSEASVLFDALLDESDAETPGRATQIRELWHFVRKNNSAEPTWYLDGLQQLE